MSEKGTDVVTFGCKVGADELKLNNVAVWTGEVEAGGEAGAGEWVASLGIVNECPEF